MMIKSIRIQSKYYIVLVKIVVDLMIHFFLNALKRKSQKQDMLFDTTVS